MTEIEAVYENGVFRPTGPVALADGQSVRLTVTPLSLDEWADRLRAARTFREWAALADACPDPGPDIDVVAAVNESRRLTGFRQPDPELPAGPQQ